MTVQELIKKHVEEKCRHCNYKKCNGIKITYDNRTVCDNEK